MHSRVLGGHVGHVWWVWFIGLGCVNMCVSKNVDTCNVMKKVYKSDILHTTDFFNWHKVQ